MKIPKTMVVAGLLSAVILAVIGMIGALVALIIFALLGHWWALLLIPVVVYTGTLVVTLLIDKLDSMD